MPRYIWLILIVIIAYLNQAYCQREGESCNDRGVQGVCTQFRRCRSAIEFKTSGGNPKNCTFVGNIPIVCCTNSTSTTNQNQCPPIRSDAVKIKKTGQKSWDKCIDWIEHVIPCTSDGTLMRANRIRMDRCSHNVAPLIVGGTVAAKNEFPHMALLGFDVPGKNTPTWACGGTLISERWVMTAAHCLYNRQTATDVKHVRLGSEDVDASANPALTFTVAEMVQHPNYKPPSIYNDIALLKLDRDVTFSAAIIPACLHTGNSVNDKKFIATGWGFTSTSGTRSNKLMKVILEKFEYAECSRLYPPANFYRDGLRDASQICAGHHTEKKDTCQGDSGGPLQLYNTDVYCTYTIVGITSIGRECGVVRQPALYTRVSNFIPWIEQTVWP